MEETKVLFPEVANYVSAQVDYVIGSLRVTIPQEQKEDIKQEALMRAWKAYQNLRGDRWKAFMQHHAEGAVLDYLRNGKGFLEEKWKSRADKEVESDESEPEESQETKRTVFRQQLLSRVEFTGDDDKSISIDETLGSLDVFTDPLVDIIKPKWDLLCRLVSDDEDLHIVCKVVLGFTQEEIAESFDRSMTRERISQRIYQFFQRLDAPENLNSDLIHQCIYALGLSDHFGTRDIDLRIGWDKPAFDLMKPDSIRAVRDYWQKPMSGVLETKLNKPKLPKGQVSGSRKTSAPDKEAEAHQLDLLDLGEH